MRRVAVTGIGLLCALGRGKEAVWGAVRSGSRAFGDPDLFGRGGASEAPVGEIRGLAGEVRPGESRLDAMIRLACDEAIDEARLAGSPDLARFGVALGNSNGGMLEAEEWFSEGLASGSSRGSAAGALRVPASVSTDRLAARMGARGPRLTVTTACSSSALAIALATGRIRDGELPAMIAGGGDTLCRLTYAGFASLRLMDPAGCRPFDADRRGLTLGEGAAVLVLEEMERARARGARILAEIRGHGASCDAWHMTGCHPEGRGMKAAMAEALDRSDLLPADIGYVNAHGTATPANDAAEGRALAEIFGSREGPAVSSTKSMHGHLLGGSGALEAAVTIMALARGVLPATAGTARLDDELAVNLLTGASVRSEARHAISNSFGFGGGNLVIALSVPGSAREGDEE
jgi:3-oxoacyl-(acyl-carrier-protein) synthase